MAITFKEAPAARMLGRRVNAEEWNGFSRVFETAPSAQLGFGQPVARGTDDRGCVEYTGSNTFIGIAETSQILPHTGDYYVQYDTVPVMEWGVIAVDVGSTAVTAGAAASWDNTNSVWVEADSSNTAVDGAVFETSGSGIQALRLRA